MPDSGNGPKEYKGWDEWSQKFKPQLNHFNSDEDNRLYETYGEEWEYIKTLDERKVWSYIEGSTLIAGVSVRDTLGYYLCDVPWEHDMDSALLSQEVECECFDKSWMEETGEPGDPDCGECLGSGYVISYLS